MAHDVTVLIPTCGRPQLLMKVLEGLQAQTFKDFEVLLVLKPHDYETIKIVDFMDKFMDIRIIFQERSGLMNAYKEGIRNSHGDLIIFLDDDAFPAPNCIQEHLLTYDNLDVVGVSGDVIPSFLINGKVTPIEGRSEIVNFYRERKILRALGEKFWNRPLEGQENYLAYISKAGYSQKNIRNRRSQNITDSLLCMAANLSILRSVTDDYQIPTFLKRGIAFEQIVGWHLWKKGYRTVFNPKAKVYHIRHGQTMSRSLNIKAVFEATIENELLFYFLFSKKEKISKMHRIIALTYYSIVHVKQFSENWIYKIQILKGILSGNLIGLKYLTSKRWDEVLF